VRVIKGAPKSDDAAKSTFFSVDQPFVVLDTVKKAEDSDHDVVVRLYECDGTRGSFHLSTHLPVKSAVLCNLAEKEIADHPLSLQVSTDKSTVELSATPFQIVTVKLKF